MKKVNPSSSPLSNASAQLPQDQLGLCLAAVLKNSSDADIAPHMAERLRAARERALAARAQAASAGQIMGQGGGAAAAVLGGLGGWWSGLGGKRTWGMAALLLLMGVMLCWALQLAGFLPSFSLGESAPNAVQPEVEMLAGEVPPSAYADAGFVAFMKEQAAQSSSASPSSGSASPSSDDAGE